MKPLIIVGAGGFGRETFEIARSLGIPIRGFVDDDEGLHGTVIHGVPVLGSIDSVQEHADARVVITTGHPGNYFSRKRIVTRLGLADERYATVVHPAAVVPPSSSLGVGSVIHAGVVLTVDVQIGNHVAIMPGVTLTHDDVVSDYVTFGAGVRVAGRVQVATGAYLGSGALIREDRSIGCWSLIGMGSVVTRDVPDGEVWAGVPARRIRPVDVPGDVQ